jgi:hypothetical protein|uniref:hypothetical protein n=1 Tax=Algoriphagus sp. TaxID=1872435 RepID=UPI0040487E0A
MSDIRIPDWQSRRRGYESHILHRTVVDIVATFCGAHQRKDVEEIHRHYARGN